MTAAISDEVERLTDFCGRHPQLLVLTGAGCSTASGIPAYRDATGEWMHPRPVQYSEFAGSPAVRQRYWARSALGWGRIRNARPNAAHAALATLERFGHVSHLVTQNVDGLHEAAGSKSFTDLHGRLDRVRCLGCNALLPRGEFQSVLEAGNRHWQAEADAAAAPDGDAQPSAVDYASFQVPDCQQCGGMLKPDVVFFGEPVPAERVTAAMGALAAADALLVVGSSLMLFSGFRFAREAARLGRPIAAVNQGRTRADDLLNLKLQADCSLLLPAVAGQLADRRLPEA